MGDIVTAVYRGGALYPLQALDLQESEEVRIQVLHERPSASPDEAAIGALVAAGLITLPPGRSNVPALSEAKRLQLAKKLGSQRGKPLSKIIIEERGEL
jgi:hypothetical protein